MFLSSGYPSAISSYLAIINAFTLNIGGLRGGTAPQQVMYSSSLLLLDCVTPCLPRFRFKSHLGEAAEENNKTKIPEQHNLSAVEYFRV